MAHWTNNRKCLLIGRSGLHYQAILESTLPLGSTEKIITEFYRAQGAIPTDSSDGHGLSFTRGHRWISKMSWLLPLSERWPLQTITVALLVREQSIQVDVSYNVTVCYTIIFAPNALTKETRNLQRLLQT